MDRVDGQGEEMNRNEVKVDQSFLLNDHSHRISVIHLDRPYP